MTIYLSVFSFYHEKFPHGNKFLKTIQLITNN